MAAKKKVFGTFRPFPCALRNHPKWLSLSAAADHLLRALITDELLASPIPGVCVQAGLGLIAYVVREPNAEVVRATLGELEGLGFLKIDWPTMLIYCPPCLRDAPHPRTLRALKAWESTWAKLPECEVRDQLEVDLAQAMGAQKAKVVRAFDLLRGAVDEPEPTPPKKRGPKPGSKREKSSEEKKEISEQKKFEVIPNLSAETSTEFLETPKNSEKLKVSPAANDLPPADTKDFKALAVLFPEKNFDPQTSEFRHETRDWRLETGEEKTPSDADASQAIGEPTARQSQSAIEFHSSSVEVAGPASQPNATSATQSDFARRPAPTTPPPTQAPLFAEATQPISWPSRPSKSRGSRKNGELQHPEIFWKIVDEINRARLVINPTGVHRGLDVALPNANHALAKKVDQLVAAYDEERALAILLEVVWSRAWKAGIARTDGDKTDAWQKEYGYLTLSDPFATEPAWGVSENTRGKWIDAGRPEPAEVKAKTRDLSRGSVSLPYNEAEYEDVFESIDKEQERYRAKT